MQPMNAWLCIMAVTSTAVATTIERSEIFLNLGADVVGGLVGHMLPRGMVEGLICLLYN